MSKNRYTVIVAVHLFLLKENQVLLARRFNTGWGDGLFSVPAGHLEAGETVTQAVIREAKEEVGITLATSDLIFTHVMHRRSDTDRVDFFFKAKTWQGKLYNAEPTKCDALEWFQIDTLPKNTVPYIKAAVESLRKESPYQEFGWE